MMQRQLTSLKKPPRAPDRSAALTKKREIAAADGVKLYKEAKRAEAQKTIRLRNLRLAREAQEKPRPPRPQP